jgi:hypothetical protein
VTALGRLARACENSQEFYTEYISQDARRDAESVFMDEVGKDERCQLWSNDSNLREVVAWLPLTALTAHLVCSRPLFASTPTACALVMSYQANIIFWNSKEGDSSTNAGVA